MQGNTKMLDLRSRKRRRPEPAGVSAATLLWALFLAVATTRISCLVVPPTFLFHRRIKPSSQPFLLHEFVDNGKIYQRPPFWAKRRSGSSLTLGPLASSLASPSSGGGAFSSQPSSSSSSSSAAPDKQISANSKHYTYKSKNNNKRKPSKRDQIRQLFRKAKTLERQGQWRQSKRVLQDILVLDPRDAHSHLALSRLEARRFPGSHETACRLFQAGTAACPDSVHLWQAWAVHEESHGHCAKARELFERALELDAHNPYVCHAYGLMELRSEHHAQAKELWERALTKTSTAALVCSLGELLIGQEDFEAARELYKRHVERLGTEREMTEVYLAAAWLEERYFHNLDRAVQLLETALELSPRSSLAQVALARLEGRRSASGGDDATARRLAETCAKLEQEDAQYPSSHGDGRVYNAWASLRVKAKRYQEARRILYRGLARFPNDHTLLQAAGKVEERVGNYTGARDLYSASLSIEPSAPTLVAYALLNLRSAPRTVNWNETLGLFEEALLLDQRHGPAYNAYAKTVFENLRDEEQARCIYERGLHANCTDAASIYHGYARMELALGNVHRARELLLQGNEEVRHLSVGTDSPHRDRAVFLIHTLGMLELNSNHPTGALEVFREGIERCGNSSQLLLGAALCEGKLGNEDKARELFERAVLVDEKHAQAWQAWGVMEMRAGNLKAARTLFECGIRSAPKHGALWQAYGVMESRLHHVKSARALFQKGIQVAPKFVSLYQSWASLESREGDYNAAKALISRALTLDKRNGSGWLIASEIEERLGNRGLGILLLRRGIECCPTNAQLYRALGDALVRQGKINEAREIMEKGIEADPTHAPLYHSLAELEARVFNLDALARLNKRAASIFNANALEPASMSFEAWGSKIRAAGRSQRLPRDVAALAERIVEEDGSAAVFSDEDTDPSAFIEKMMGSSFIEEDLAEGLLHQRQQNGTDFLEDG